jgi:uncharacterized membrane protein
MRTMSQRRRSNRRRDERGATLILVAVSMVLLLWGGAFGVDLGMTVVGGRQVQAIADTAALDMARYINVADWSSQILTQAASTSYLNGKLSYADTDNSSNATLSETPGVWLNSVFTPEGSEVLVGKFDEPVNCWNYKPVLTQPCNAIKITATQSVPQIFAGGHSTVTRSSIATVSPEASFSIGTYLASINSQQSAVLNALMGTVGGSASVTLVGYEGLANTDVTVNQLITASGGLLTTSNVMTTSLSGAVWQSIWNDAVTNQVSQLNCSSTPTPAPCSASSALSGPTSLDFGSGASTDVQLCQLVSISTGPSSGSTCSSLSTSNLSNSALSANLNALQILTTEAEVANGTNALDLGTSLGITGVTDAKLKLDLIQVPQVAYGPVGTTASTAQVSSDLQLSFLGTGLIDIPLSAAQGTATLTTLTCAYNAMSATDIQPTTTTVQGNITLVGTGTNLGTLTVSGLNSTTTSPVPFASGDVPPTGTIPNANNPHSVGTTTPNLGFTAGPGTTNPSLLFTLLNSTVNGVVGPILQAAGVTVGGAQIADLGSGCGSVSLVQ